MKGITEKFLNELSELYYSLSEDRDQTNGIELAIYLAADAAISFETSIGVALLLAIPFILRELYKRRLNLGEARRPLAFSLYPLALGLSTTLASYLVNGVSGLAEGLSLTVRSVLATLILALYIDRVGMKGVLTALRELGVSKWVLDLYEHVLLTVSILANTLASLLASRESRTLRPMKILEVWKHQLSSLEVFMSKVSYHLEQKTLAL